MGLCCAAPGLKRETVFLFLLSASVRKDGVDFTDIEELTFSLLSCSAAMLGGQGGVG